MILSVKTRSARSGAAAVEFALVSFPVFMLIFGMMEVSRAMMVSEILNHAARAGARAGTLGSGNYTTISEAVAGAVRPGGIDPADVTTAVTITPPTGTAGSPITSAGSWPSSITTQSTISVNVSAPYYKVSWVRILWPVTSNPTLRGTASMPRE